MFSILFVVGAVYAGLSSTKTAGQAVASAIPFGFWKKNKELQENMKLGINTEYEEFKKTQKNPREESFELFRFEASSLPPSLHFLVKQTWVLTELELFGLFAMVRRQMLEAGEGPYAEQMQALCAKYQMDYGELMMNARLLAAEIDFERLIWLSDNRMKNKHVRKILLQNG